MENSHLLNLLLSDGEGSSAATRALPLCRAEEEACKEHSILRALRQGCLERLGWGEGEEQRDKLFSTAPLTCLWRDFILVSCLPHSWSALLLPEFTFSFISLATLWFPTPASLTHIWLNPILRNPAAALATCATTSLLPAAEVRTGHVCTHIGLT